MKSLWCMLLLGMILSACARKPEKPEETATKGTLFMLAAESHEGLMKQEAAEFARLYPDVTVDVAGVSTREAIVHFLNDSVKCICVDRPLNKEELDVATSAGVLYAENVIAQDALAVLVHSRNPKEVISYDEVRDVVAGTKSVWKNIAGPAWTGTIEFVLTGKNSGAYELLQRHFFHLSNEPAVNVLVTTQQDALAYVSTHPQAFGIVSVAALRNNSLPVKVLAVESTDMTGERYVKPNQKNIHRSLYPLSYSLYLYTSSTGVQAGFSTFVRTLYGQKIMENAGLVPAVIPNRIIQITTE
ncbi:MAG: substrate-binding domain-containing protein [Ignavibacteriales bacterium]|nr:substrate-binding domain-containing protein [Ignavibacteriales bacterium]